MASKKMGRRRFLATAGKGVVASSVVAGFPAIVPASVFGAASPSNRINVGAIGTGRISRGHDLPGIWQHDIARVMAACDLDSRRVEDATSHEDLGQVADIIETGANDVYIVRGAKGEILVPAIKDVVKHIDPATGRMVIQPLPGMLPG